MNVAARAQAPQVAPSPCRASPPSANLPEVSEASDVFRRLVSRADCSDNLSYDSFLLEAAQLLIAIHLQNRTICQNLQKESLSTHKKHRATSKQIQKLLTVSRCDIEINKLNTHSNLQWEETKGS